jgi:hypothetical protein
MWNLKCPGKVKQFLWRFTHNSLAVRRNLSRRGVEIENTACVMLEDGSHLFLKCKYVKRIWRELCLEDQRSAMAGKPSAKEVTAYILQLYGNLQLKVVLTMWLWWNERNGVREGELQQTLHLWCRRTCRISWSCIISQLVGPALSRQDGINHLRGG